MTEETNFNYRIFRMKEGFDFDKLSERDLSYYKRANNFQADDRMLVLNQDEIIYIEE